jgi:hypothetical protein
MAGLAVEVHDGAVVQAVRFLRAYWLLLLPLAFILRFVYYRYSSPLRLYPGPFLASGSRAWKVWSTYSGKTETDHIHLHERYGEPQFPSPMSMTWRLILISRPDRPYRPQRAILLVTICCPRSPRRRQRIPQDRLLLRLPTRREPGHLHRDQRASSRTQETILFQRLLDGVDAKPRRLHRRHAEAAYEQTGFEVPVARADL